MGNWLTARTRFEKQKLEIRSLQLARGINLDGPWRLPGALCCFVSTGSKSLRWHLPAGLWTVCRPQVATRLQVSSLRETMRLKMLCKRKYSCFPWTTNGMSPCRCARRCYRCKISAVTGLLPACSQQGNADVGVGSKTFHVHTGDRAFFLSFFAIPNATS